jgi:hypothetical protein
MEFYGGTGSHMLGTEGRRIFTYFSTFVLQQSTDLTLITKLKAFIVIKRTKTNNKREMQIYLHEI